MNAAETVNITEVIAARPFGRAQVGVVVLCALVALFDGWDLQIIGLAAPSIARLLSIPPTSMGSIFSAALAGLALGAFILGPVADRFGRRRVLIGCTVVFAVFTLATPFAESFGSLLLIRFLTGLGLGGAAPSFIALTTEYTPLRLRPTAIALLWAGFPLGGALGGLVGAWLIPTIGWQWLFWIGGALPLVAALVLVAKLPESLGFLVASNAPSERIAALLQRVCGATVPPGVRFMLGEERMPGGNVGQLFTHGRALGTILLWISFFISYLQLVTNSTWTPILLSRVGVAVPSSALALAAFNFGSVVGTSSSGWLLSRLGASVVLPVSMTGTVIAYGLIGHAAPDVTLIIVLEIFVGLFLGCASTALLALAALYYPTAIRSTGIGWGMGMGRIGSFVGPLVVGALLASGWAVGPIFVAIAAPALIAALSAWFIRQRTS